MTNNTSMPQENKRGKSKVYKQKAKESGKFQKVSMVDPIKECLHFPRVEYIQIKQSIVVTLLDFLLLHLMKK